MRDQRERRTARRDKSKRRAPTEEARLGGLCFVPRLLFTFVSTLGIIKEMRRINLSTEEGIDYRLQQKKKTDAVRSR